MPIALYAMYSIFAMKIQTLLMTHFILLSYQMKFYLTTDMQLEQPDGVADYNAFLNKEFHMHVEDNTQGENEHNIERAANIQEQNQMATVHEISDETDSDADSIKCVYCNKSYGNLGAHTCHVTCTIENNQLQRSTSTETLVAADVTPPTLPSKPSTPLSDKSFTVSCVLCDEKYDRYGDYVIHLNKCTTNVKLHHYVCPICHDINTDKFIYLEHLKSAHFKSTGDSDQFSDPGEDCVDFAPMLEKTRRPKAVRRQIGWSIEDIYQEIECKKVEEQPTPTSSPIKTFFSKFGNE